MAELHDLADDVTGFAREAAYVAVGLGILGYQRAQVRRVEMGRRLGCARQLDDHLEEVRGAVRDGAQRLDEVLEHAVQLVEAAVAPLEEQLPPPARELAGKAHAGARQVREQLRALGDTPTDR